MYLLASDFDGTLWFRNHMKEKDIEAIQKFRKQGHLFGVCTGRSLKGVVDASSQYPIEYDFYILLSGGLILNKHKEVIFEKLIPTSLVHDIYLFVNKQNMSVVYQDNMYSTGSFDDEFKCSLIESVCDIDTQYVNAFSFHFHENEIDKTTQTTQAIQKQFGQYVDVYQNNNHIDLTAKGCSKGEAVHFIQNYFHLDESQIAVIGDSWNDLPMLKQVKNSYTFTYAPHDVQETARHVVSQLCDCIEDFSSCHNQ